MELRQTKTRCIDGVEYEVTQLGAIAGTRVFTRAMKLLGPALSAKNMAGGASAAIAALDEKDVEWFCQQFSPLTVVKGRGQLDKIFDAHFVGRYKALFTWLLFCLEVNFSDFLGGRDLGAEVEKLLAKGSESSPSISPSPATGPSGES